MKKNLNKVPTNIFKKIKQFKKRTFFVAVVRKISESEIRENLYEHLWIGMKGNELNFSISFLPRAESGRYSDVNINGKEIIRKDLPMVTNSYDIEVPNYGDWYNSSHTVTIDRDVYQRETLGPKEIEMEVELLKRELDDRNYVFKFSINQILDKKKRGFKKDLLFCLNLLQENVGAVDVYESDAQIDDYLKTIYVNWEILPPGEREDAVINKILDSFSKPKPEIAETIKDRYEFIKKLKPLHYIYGTNSFRRYFGAKLTDNLVIFENIEYGNAIYVMFDKWEKLSQLSRIELLKQRSSNEFERIVHKKGWKKALKNLIKMHKELMN